MDYQHDRTKVYLVNYHFVWTPKRRRKVLVGDIKTRLEQLINQVATEQGLTILSLVVQPDHVHLFISATPTVPAHKIIKYFKGRTSHDLRKEFPELLKLPSLWTRSYFVSTAGNVCAETIQHYIEAQSKE